MARSHPVTARLTMRPVRPATARPAISGLLGATIDRVRSTAPTAVLATAIGPEARALASGLAWVMIGGPMAMKQKSSSFLFAALVLGLVAAGCGGGNNGDAGTGDFDSGPPGMDSGGVDGGQSDAGEDAGPPDSGPGCVGLVCEPFQYCDGDMCRDYPACRGDGTCDRPGDVCHARRCVPGDVDIDGDGSVASEDCDETDPGRYPGNMERCNAVDDDCDMMVDEGDPDTLCESNPGGGTCIAGSCGCPAGTYDLDRSIAGCECVAAPPIDEGLTCETAVDLGSVDDSGQMLSVTGNVMPDDREVWYRFVGLDSDDAASLCDDLHVRVQFTTNPTDTFEFMVLRGACDATPSCDSTGSELTDYSYARDFRAPDMAGMLAGECPCHAPGSPVADQSVCSDNTADYFVRVRRRVGSMLACDPFTLEFSNGVY